MLDWDDLRFFLALARSGSLSAASRNLRVAQSTVGRRLASLESSLGVRLLNRTPNGYLPTLAGQDVREQAERVEAAALHLEHTVGGRDTRLAGLVRVTCAETIASQLLAPCLASLSAEHAEIMIEMIPDPREVSLSMREADISVRLDRAEQNELVICKIGSLGFGLYASQAYLERHGTPEFDEGCAGQFLITQNDDIRDAARIGWLDGLAPRARVSMQTSSHETAVAASLHGGGLACLARFRADQEGGLCRLATPTLPPHAAIWLVVHKDNRATPRVRVILAHITACVRNLAAALNPAEMAGNAVRDPRERPCKIA